MTRLGRRLGRVLAAVGRSWRRLEVAHDAVFVARWRRDLRREAQRQQDTLRTLVLLESLGVANPVGYETMDLIPYLVADLHAWHQRMGEPSFGEPRVCC